MPEPEEKVTDAELAIMQVLWAAEEPLTLAQVKAALAGCGRDLSSLEEAEPEPSLGNGGLGRLAACFLDSIAALGLPGDGVGLNYHYGLFEQKLEHNKQTETPNPWIEEESWLIPTDTAFEVPFGFGPVKAKLFDIAVPGAHSGIANRLHLFDVEEPAGAPEEAPQEGAAASNRAQAACDLDERCLRAEARAGREADSGERGGESR